MSLLICSGCGAENSPFNFRCQACGQPLPETDGPIPETGASWAGRVLGPYLLLGRLGSGSMGSVYRETRGRSGRCVAVKTVPSVREELLPRARREIQALWRIRHPGVVRILGHGIEEGVPWYAMELVQGPTLRERLGARPGESLQDRLTVLRRLCAALGYLPGEGLLHRDLKPENVVLRGGVEPVLVDFGLAAEVGSASGRETLAVERGLAGTPLYMAPEQIRGELLDARADLYALGCIVDQTVTGRPPFRSESRSALLQAHLEAEPIPRSRLALDEGPQQAASELDTLVLRLLAKDPCERLGYADDVAAALEALGAGNGWAPGAPRPRAYLYRPALAGRKAVLGALEERLERLEAGISGLVLVGGESGMGTTRLLLEVARRAAGRQMQVLAGECVPSGAGPSLEDGIRRAAGAAGSGSVRVARVRSRRSQAEPGIDAAGLQGFAAARSPAGGTGPLEALCKPLQAVADRCRERGPQETDRLLGRRGKVLCLYEPALAGLPGQEAHPEAVELPPEGRAAAPVRVSGRDPGGVRRGRRDGAAPGRLAVGRRADAGLP